MKIDFDGIQAFALIAELGGFRKAADHLHLTQTALTRRIQKLESYLGVRLLERTTRSLHLTTIGREFLPQAQRMVSEMTSAVGRLKDISRLGQGNITMASVPTMAHQTLPSAIRRYTRQYPGNRIRIIESSALEVSRAVLREQAEFGLTIALERQPELVEVPLFEEPFMFFCRNDNLLGARQSITWKELRQTDLIMVSSLSGNRALLDYHLAKQRISLQGMYEVEHLSTAIALISAGVGTAILPFSTVQDGTYPALRRIALVQPVVRRTIILIRRRNAALSPATQVFHDMLAKQLESAAALTRKSTAVATSRTGAKRPLSPAGYSPP